MKKILYFCLINVKIIYAFMFGKMFFKNCGCNFNPGFNFKFSAGANIKIGDNFTGMGAIFFYANEGELIIGNNCGVSTNIQFGAANGRVSIGDDVMIASNVVLRAADHGISKNNLMRNNEYNSGDIIIEDDVWIGANVVILKNVTLEKGCVIGAGSVVTKSIPAYAIAVGNPAKVIKYRK